MAETLEFDPASLGATEADFDPSILGASPVDSFDPSSLGAVQEQDTPIQGSNLSSVALSSAARGGLQAVTGAIRVGSVLYPQFKGLADEIAKSTGLATTDEFLTELEGASSRASDEYGVDPKQKGLLVDIASGAGSLLPTLASGPTAPFTTAAMMGEQGLQEAQQAGATGAQQATAFLGNAATGFVTEKLLGLPALLKSAQKARLPQKTLRALIGSITKQMGLSFVREGTQEALEQVSQDTIAKYIAAYDPERKVFDGKKLLKTALVGGLLGAPVGGLVQAATDLDSSKEQNQIEAEQVDQTLSQAATIQPPPLPTNAVQERPTETVLRNVPEQPIESTGQVPTQESPERVPQGTEAQPDVPAEAGFVGTALNTVNGLVTEGQGTSHAELLGKAIEQEVPFESMTKEQQGFVFRGPDGELEFRDRVETGKLLTESGQLVGLPPGEPVTSEHIRNEVPGVTFNPTPTAKVSANQAAETLQTFFNEAVEVARKAGAQDPEAAASQAQIELSNQVEQGRTTLDNPKSLFMEAARRQAGKQKVVEQTTEPEPVTTRGPRAETISDEDTRSIDTAINRLPDTQKSIIQKLAEDPTLTDQDLSEELGLTIDQVKKGKSAARKTLQSFIQEQGIGLSMGPGAASAAEVLVRYEERKFGKRFQETEEIAPEIKRDTGDRYYEPIPNQVTAQKATELIETNGEEAIESEIRDDKSTLSYADRSTVGQILIKRYNERYKSLKESNPEEAKRVLDKAADLAEWAADFGTKLGQGVQSFAMWSRLTPEGKLRTFQKMVRKKRDSFTRDNRNDIDEIKDTLNGATKESATKASGSQKVKANVATAKRGAGADKPIWDQYKEDISKRMASLLPGEVPVKERGPLEKFTNQVFQLFKGKVAEPSGPKTKPPNIVRVRQMISEWRKLKEAWREAWTKLRDTDVAEHRAYIDKVSNYLDAPFTEGDIRSVMREMPIFSPSRLGQLSEFSGRTAVRELADVLLDENPNATKEMRGKIEDYAQKIIESERSKYQEAKAKAEAAKKEKGKPQPRSLDRDVWVQYQQQAIKNLETALVGGKPNEQAALQEFTNRLVSALKGRIPAKITEPKTAQEKKAEDTRVIREAMTNRDKYEEVWTNTTNALKLKYGNRPDILRKIDEVFAGGLKNPLNPKTLQSLIRERIKSDEIKLSDLVRQHYSKAEVKGKSLADKISEEIGLDEAGSREVANSIESEFASEVTKTKARALASLVKINPTAKKISKSDAQKLIEVSNLGALTDKTFYDAVSESLGLPEYSQAVSAEILRMANDIDAAPEGMPKMEATLKLNKFLAQQKGFDPSDLLFGVYYGNILSGLQTQGVNLLDTTLNVINESVNLAIRNPTKAIPILRGLAKGFATGKSDAITSLLSGRRISDGKFVEDPFLMEVADFGKKGGVPIKTNTAAGRAAKRFSESVLGTPLKLYKYIGRAMAASDAFAFRGAQEAKAAQLAYQIANEQGPNTTEYVNRILGYDRIPEFQKQAESEGYKGNQARARATELMIMSRPPEIQKAATEFAAEATYNVKPYGIMGAVSNSIEGLSRNVKPLKLVVPFTRIVANVMNRGLNNSPYGYVSAIRGKTFGGKHAREFTTEERNAMLVRATISTTLVAALVALHEAGALTIHGQGPSDPEKKKQLRQSGWKPYTIQIGNTYLNYNLTPFGLVMAATGNWLDNEKYQDFSSKEGLDKFAYSLQSVASTMFNQSFLSGLSTVFDAIAGKSPAQQISAGKRFTANTVSSLGVPFNSALKDIEAIFSEPNIPRVDSMRQAMIASIPFASQGLQPQLNALGEPVKSSRSRFLNFQNDDPVWKLVYQKGLRVPVPNTFFDAPDDQYEYVKQQGQALRKWMEANLNRLNGMSAEDAQNAIENASNTFRERERNKLIFEGRRKKEKKR